MTSSTVAGTQHTTRIHSSAVVPSAPHIELAKPKSISWEGSSSIRARVVWDLGFQRVQLGSWSGWAAEHSWGQCTFWVRAGTSSRPCDCSRRPGHIEAFVASTQKLRPWTPALPKFHSSSLTWAGQCSHGSSGKFCNLQALSMQSLVKTCHNSASGTVCQHATVELHGATLWKLDLHGWTW